MGKVPKKSDMIKMDEKAAAEKVRPAKKVMQAIGESLLKPKKKKKAPKIPAGPSSQNSKKQNRVDKPDMTKDAEDQE